MAGDLILLRKCPPKAQSMPKLKSVIVTNCLKYLNACNNNLLESSTLPWEVDCLGTIEKCLQCNNWIISTIIGLINDFSLSVTIEVTLPKYAKTLSIKSLATVTAV